MEESEIKAQTEKRNLLNFVEESNRIEGIEVPQARLQLHYDTTLEFIKLTRWGLEDLTKYVYNIQPENMKKAVLRVDPDTSNVVIGDHIPMESGPGILIEMAGIINRSNNNYNHPWEIHQMFEHLHPYTDCNGRAGRVVWAWQMHKFAYDYYWQERGFLKSYYYQTLAQYDSPLKGIG